MTSEIQSVPRCMHWREIYERSPYHTIIRYEQQAKESYCCNKSHFVKPGDNYANEIIGAVPEVAIFTRNNEALEAAIIAFLAKNPTRSYEALKIMDGIKLSPALDGNAKQWLASTLQRLFKQKKIMKGSRPPYVGESSAYIIKINKYQALRVEA